MISRWGAALTVLVLALGAGAVFAAPNPTDTQGVATHELSEDELSRLQAVMQDAKSQNRASPVTAAVSGSIDEAAAKFDAQPGMHAILAAHGFTARDFTIAVLSLSRTVMMAHSGGSGPNVDLYQHHRADIDGALNMTASGPDFRPVNPAMANECGRVGMAPVRLLQVSSHGTTPPPPEIREKMAQSMIDLSGSLPEANLRDDFNIVADEIRRQSGEVRFIPTPRYSQAMGDVQGWIRSNCALPPR